MSGWMDKWMGGWMDRGMDKWTERWMDRGMDGIMNPSLWAWIGILEMEVGMRLGYRD